MYLGHGLQWQLRCCVGGRMFGMMLLQWVASGIQNDATWEFFGLVMKNQPVEKSTRSRILDL